MKVLHLSTTDYNGGAAIAAYRLMEGLVSQSVDVKMLVLNKTTDNPLVIKVEDIRNKNRVFRFIKDITRKLNFYYKSYRWAQYSKKRDIALDDVYVSYLEDCLERLEFDILHLNQNRMAADSSPVTLLSLIALQARRKPSSADSRLPLPERNSRSAFPVGHSRPLRHGLPEGSAEHPLFRPEPEQQDAARNGQPE